MARTGDLVASANDQALKGRGMLFKVETTYREIDCGGRIGEYRKYHWKDLEKAHRDWVLQGLWRRARAKWRALAAERK